MEPKVWVTSDDGTLHYQQMTNNYLDEAVKIMGDSFFRHENVCTAMGVNTDSEAIAELCKLAEIAAKDGVSLIAIDKENNKVAGVLFNKIQVRQDAENTSDFEQFINNCKQTKSKQIVNFMIKCDSHCDLFDHCQVDCLLELMFLGVLPEYRGKGIGKQLFKIALEMGRLLTKGVNVKQSIDGKNIGLEPIPKIATSILTSFITQKIGRDLNFEVVFKKKFDEIQYEGINFGGAIADSSKYIEFVYKTL